MKSLPQNYWTTGADRSLVNRAGVGFHCVRLPDSDPAGRGRHHLIDPVSGGDPLTVLAPVAEVLSNKWILHSADQDLPCLAEVGMRPPALYDTELAGRLAGSIE